MGTFRDFILNIFGRGSGREPDFRVIADNNSDILIQVGQDRLTAYISPACSRLLGWQPEELIGKGPEVFIDAESLPAIHADMVALAMGERDEGTVLNQKLICKDGGSVWVESRARAIRDPGTGRMTGLIVTMRDATEHKKQNDFLASMAWTDGLTDLPNRRALDVTLERESSRASRDHSELSLLLIDIDKFKDFNDTYGHQAGDKCLRRVASLVRENCHRPGDLPARYGGEEFAVVLPQTGTTGARTIADRIRIAVECALIPHLRNQEGGGKVTVSIGVATIGDPGGKPERLLAIADKALYRAKQGGRNRIEAEHPLSNGAGQAA